MQKRSMKRLPLFRRPHFAKRILEVGGGHAPYEGVTHAVDKFPDDNGQRASSMLVPNGVEFRRGDLEEIPFANEEPFDFFYASHVLEHVNDPSKAVSEINRVTRRGYLETPSPLREQIACPYPLDANDFHTFYCWTGKDANTIHVARKSEKTLGNFCDCENGKFARALFELRRKSGHDIEPMLPRDAKTTKLHFTSPLQLRVHEDLKSACAQGACAYPNSVVARLWSSLPLSLISGRFGRLRELVSEAKVRH